MRRAIALLLLVLALGACQIRINKACAEGLRADAIPRTADLHRRVLTREAQAQWGLKAPVARFAAQVHQESAWRSEARSAYAGGLAQFTPATAEWISRVYPRELGEQAPYSPKWALRALVVYDRHLYDRIDDTATDCDRWAMTLSSYNGGGGWLNRDRRLAAASGADPNRWWGSVEHHTARAPWARDENRGYPRRILLNLEPLYLARGWPGEAVCR